MPPVSKAQNALMQAAAASPKVAKRTGVLQRVASPLTRGKTYIAAGRCFACRIIPV